LNFLSLAELISIKEGEVNQMELAGHKKIKYPEQKLLKLFAT